MKVILEKDLESLGEIGDIVEVSDGYARNFLIPRNVAKIATKGALEDRERNQNRLKSKAEKLYQQALEQAEKIKTIGTLELQVKAGESGKLFGAVTTRKLADEIKEKTEVEVDRRNISLNNPINHVGEYTMKIKISSKVEFELPIVITPAEMIKE